MDNLQRHGIAYPKIRGKFTRTLCIKLDTCCTLTHYTSSNIAFASHPADCINMIDFQYTPYLLPLLFAALTAWAVAALIWQRRPGAGVVPFVILMLAVGGWSFFYAAELSTADQQSELILANIQYVAIVLIPAAWFVFMLQYTGREKWLTRRRLALLAVEPVLLLIGVWADQWLHIVWISRTIDTSGSFALLNVVKNYGFWAHSIYSYILLVISTFLLIQALIRSPGVYRGQTVTLLIGTFAPWVANFLYISGLNPFPKLDLTTFAFTITGLSLGWSLVRFRLIDIAPVARDRVFEGISDAVLVVDARRRIVDINPAALSLLNRTSAAPLLGQPAGEVLVGMSDLISQFRDVPEARTEITLGKDAQARHFQLRISPLTDRQGRLTGRLFVLHEISELKRAAEQIKAQNDALLQTNQQLAEARTRAEEASRLKSEFLATMSHELRTPLNAIIGYTDLMLTGLTGKVTDKQEDYLQRVVANGERLLALINDVLDIAKIEASRLDINNEPFSPAELLSGIESRISSLADQKGLRFETQIDPALPLHLQGDAKRLEQILTNLVGNAIRFTESGGVSVRFARSEDAQWTLAVTDTGIGIPAHALDYIFDEFRQVDGSAKREYGGTGLGLAIVRKLATLMGGTVRVQSEIGKGSTFIVVLPLLVAETAPAAEKLEV